MTIYLSEVQSHTIFSFKHFSSHCLHVHVTVTWHDRWTDMWIATTYNLIHASCGLPTLHSPNHLQLELFLHFPHSALLPIFTRPYFQNSFSWKLLPNANNYHNLPTKHYRNHCCLGALPIGNLNPGSKAPFRPIFNIPAVHGPGKNRTLASVVIYILFQQWERDRTSRRCSIYAIAIPLFDYKMLCLTFSTWSVP